MKILVKESGKDPKGEFSKARNTWVVKFMKRKGLSVQVKTGKKHQPMKNFHWHSIYQMPLLDP